MRIKLFLVQSVVIIIIVLLVLYGLILKTGLNETLTKPLITSEQPKDADIIVVLGSGVQKKTGKLPKKAQERVLTGIKLWQAGWSDTVLMSGGEVKRTDYIESEVMRDFAIEHGLPNSIIILEKRSTDTHGNAKFTKQAMEQSLWKDALVVTSDFHTKRACKVFRAQHVTITCILADSSLVDQSSAGDKVKHFIAVIREYGATVLYTILGYI